MSERVGELAKITARIAEAGGNILAVTNSRLLAHTQREVMIKEVGADPEKLASLLRESDLAVIDIRSSARYQPHLVG
jgi:uncharacterized protein with ACT and thioredoxin-like domain